MACRITSRSVSGRVSSQARTLGAFGSFTATPTYVGAIFQWKCAARASYSSGISTNVWHVDAVTVSRAVKPGGPRQSRLHFKPATIKRVERGRRLYTRHADLRRLTGRRPLLRSHSLRPPNERLGGVCKHERNDHMGRGSSPSNEDPPETPGPAVRSLGHRGCHHVLGWHAVRAAGRLTAKQHSRGTVVGPEAVRIAPRQLSPALTGRGFSMVKARQRSRGTDVRRFTGGAKQ
jgi:hypothetical protein